VTSWLSITVASLLGSLHCVGMCGGLIGFYAATERDAKVAPWVPHAAYHLTRLGAYMLLGAIAGGLGSALDVLGSHAGLGNLGVLIAGATLVFWGAPVILGRRAKLRLLALGRAPAAHGRFVARLEGLFVALTLSVRQRSPLWRASALGLSSALLPCGWLYAFVALAAATGSSWAGAGLLLAFWAGTVPALLGLGLGVDRLGQGLRSRLPRISAALVLVVCAVNIVQRWPVASAREPGALEASEAPHCHDTH
jgi:uncharacterized protein